MQLIDASILHRLVNLYGGIGTCEDYIFVASGVVRFWFSR